MNLALKENNTTFSSKNAIFEKEQLEIFSMSTYISGENIYMIIKWPF